MNSFSIPNEDNFILLPRPRQLTLLAGKCEHDPTTARIEVDVASDLPREGYKLKITPEGIRITASDEAGVFYAKMTLRQIELQHGKSLPGCEITDHPDFPVRGVMLDVSRGKVPTMESLYRLVDELAGWKINRLELYCEHTFAYRNHQEVWKNASPLTHDEIRGLDAYCRERFVELVPNQQSFGHFKRWLEIPRYQALAEDPHAKAPDTLCPIDPRCLDLLNQLYDELLPCFSTKKFNVCCDETALGKVRSKEECEKKGAGRVYLEFLLKIHQMVKARGLTMQFWGDIIFHYPELISELPRDVVVLDWGYENTAPFDAHGATLAAAGIPFYVCPGTSSWNSLVGRTDNCLGNLRNAAVNGLKHGAAGFLITDWGDRAGHLQYLPISYVGFAAGAALSWCGESNQQQDRFISALDLHVFQDPAKIMGQLAIDLGNTYQSETTWTADQDYPHDGSLMPAFLYYPEGDAYCQQHILHKITPDELRAAHDHIERVMIRLDESRMQRTDGELIKSEFSNAAKMLRFSCQNGVRIYSDSLQGTGKLRELAEEMQVIIPEHERLWRTRNREGGLECSVDVLKGALKDCLAAVEMHCRNSV